MRAMFWVDLCCVTINARQRMSGICVENCQMFVIFTRDDGCCQARCGELF